MPRKSSPVRRFRQPETPDRRQKQAFSANWNTRSHAILSLVNAAKRDACLVVLSSWHAWCFRLSRFPPPHSTSLISTRYRGLFSSPFLEVTHEAGK